MARTVYSPRPSVRGQIHPRALEIIDPVFKISDKYDAYGTPLYRGIPHDAWQEIAQKKSFSELLGILHRDYPSFAALCQKIWAKKVGHLMPFIFNRVQTLFWDAIAQQIRDEKPLFFDVLKARQLGISTQVNGWTHWQVWRLNDIEALLVTHDKPLAYSFIDRLRIFHEELPQVPGIIRTLRSQTKTARVPREELYYNETRSKATTVVAKSADTRGRSTPHNHLAEYAFYPEAAELLGALMPQLPPAGSPGRLQCSVIIESTPNGKNDFYEHWQMTKEPESEWTGKFFPWYVAEDMYSETPHHGWKMTDEQRTWSENLAHLRKKIDGVERITPAQVYWYEKTLLTEAGGNQDKMDAEYPSDDETCFLLRSRSIFKYDMRYLQQTVMEAERRAPEAFRQRGIVCTKSFLRGHLEYDNPYNPFGSRPMTVAQIMMKPKFVESPDGHLVLWEPPFPNHDYVAGLDAASGLMESDNSVAQLVDVTTGRQMGEYAGRVSPEQLADDAVALGWYFNTALLYPEVNSVGVVTMKRIKQIWNYPRLGREEKWDEIGVKANKYGHFTNHDQKMVMVSFLKYVVSNKFLAISSDALLSEMSTFVQRYSKDGVETFEADDNSMDDRVMGLCLALMVIRQSPKLLSDFTKAPHRVHIPTAVESGIHDAPTPTSNKPAIEALDPKVREALGLDGGILSMPANPIRGPLELTW